jgi:L-fucose isomerase-like protein
LKLCSASDKNGIVKNVESIKGDVEMLKETCCSCHVGRRDFLKTSAVAGMVAAIPATSIFGQEDSNVSKPRRTGAQRNVLFINDTPEAHASFVDSIRAIKGMDLQVTSAKVNYRQPEEIRKTIESNDPDILVLIMSQVSNTVGDIATSTGDLEIPVVIVPVNLDLIMLEADLVAAFKARGKNALLANSAAEALELIRVLASPGILEGKRALIYGRPFDSTSVPVHNLNANYVYQRTGVRIEYRPIQELKKQLESVDEAKAVKEMERWKREATKIVEPPDSAILECSRMYVLLRSIVEKEGLSCISIDCLNFSFNPNPILPLPCLAFTRLRDEGFAAPCEADVCGSLSSMLLQEISKKPSYFCNVSSVNEETSSTVLRHCVAPVQLLGREATPLSYNLRDYHGFGRGVTPEVQFPSGLDVTMGLFGKDLKSFVLWPGITRSRTSDTDRPSFPGTTNPAMKKVRRYCSNHLEVKINDVRRFVQSIGGIHHAMVAGNYAKAIYEEMLKMNVSIIGPSEMTNPKV